MSCERVLSENSPSLFHVLNLLILGTPDLIGSRVKQRFDRPYRYGGSPGVETLKCASKCHRMDENQNTFFSAACFPNTSLGISTRPESQQSTHYLFTTLDDQKGKLVPDPCHRCG